MIDKSASVLEFKKPIVLVRLSMVGVSVQTKTNLIDT